MQRTRVPASVRSGAAARLSFIPGLLIALFACLPTAASGQTGSPPPAPAATEHHHHHHAPPAGPGGSAGLPRPEPGAIVHPWAKVTIPNLTVFDQDGKQVRFYSDLIKGKTVVLNFFFTECINVCPMMGQAIERLRAELGERVGRDVFFVSVSKEPETDTPARLKAWGDSYGAGPGWTLVTGDKKTMEKIVMELGGQYLGASEHSFVLLVGNDRTGNWKALSGYTRPKELIEQIDRVKNAPAR